MGLLISKYNTTHLKELMMSDLIKNGSQLYTYFEENEDVNIFVSAEVRQEALIHTKQGKLTVNGSSKRLSFTHMGGGIYYTKLIDNKM